MFDRSDWLVPHAHGQPYLAKPPLIYWCQLALAQARSAVTGRSPRPTEWDLRITVAIAGWLGVLACYALAWRMTQTLLESKEREPKPGSTPNARSRFAISPAFWCSAMLATGLLYVRSSRLGELDILLAPTVTLAVLALSIAWTSTSTTHRVIAWFGGALSASLAMLAKGPPALLVIALATIGAVVLRAAWARPRDSWIIIPRPIRLAIAASTVLSVAWLNKGSFELLDAALALPIFGLVAVVTMLTLAQFAAPGVLSSIARDLWRMQPWLVLLPPVLAFLLWTRAVAARIGWEALARARAAETSDNLRLFVAESPLNNLQAASFGVGLGSLATLTLGLWWWKRMRADAAQRHAPGLWIVIAWLVLSLIAFSVLGKGVARYLTPVWPAIALVGGLALHPWLATRRASRRPWLTGVALLAILSLAIGQAVWHGRLMEKYHHRRSPREVVRRIAGEFPHAVWGTLDFEAPAVAYYLDGPVRRLSTQPLGGRNGPRQWFKSAAASDQPWILLATDEWFRKHHQNEATTWASILAMHYPRTPDFIIDNGRTNVHAITSFSWGGLRAAQAREAAKKAAQSPPAAVPLIPTPIPTPTPTTPR